MAGSHRLLLQRLPPSVSVLLEQLRDDVATDRSPQVLHPPGDLPPRQVGPLHLQPHRVARGMVFEHPVEVDLDRRVDLDQPVCVHPLFSRAACVQVALALQFRQAPLGSSWDRIPGCWRSYSIPPCPSLAASMAAYRRRSLSLSESKSLFIIRSTSGRVGVHVALPDAPFRIEGRISYPKQDREVIPGLFLRRIRPHGNPG